MKCDECVGIDTGCGVRHAPRDRGKRHTIGQQRIVDDHRAVPDGCLALIVDGKPANHILELRDLGVAAGVAAIREHDRPMFRIVQPEIVLQIDGLTLSMTPPAQAGPAESTDDDKG